MEAHYVAGKVMSWVVLERARVLIQKIQVEGNMALSAKTVALEATGSIFRRACIDEKEEFRVLSPKPAFHQPLGCGGVNLASRSFNTISKGSLMLYLQNMVSAVAKLPFS